MKSTVLIIVVLLILFFNMQNSYSTTQAEGGILYDLSLLEQLEDKDRLNRIEAYSKELTFRFNGGISIAKSLEDFGGMRKADVRPLRAHELLYALAYRGQGIGDDSLLFRDDIFIEYYMFRTKKVVEEYMKTGNIDINGFIAGAKREFDLFLKAVKVSRNKAERMTLLLQDKLLDKMHAAEVINKNSYIDQVLELRLYSNSEKRNQYSFELMESRVRLKLLEELIDINRTSLKSRLDAMKVSVKFDGSGILSLRYISDIEKRTVFDYSVYLTDGDQDYKLVLPLSRLVGLYGKAVFTAKGGNERIASRDSILDKVIRGKNGALEVKLEDTYISENELPGYDILSIMPQQKAAIDIHKLVEEGGRLESIAKEARKEAHEAAKSLNALSSYLELKEKGIRNSITDGFEAGKSSWLTSLNTKLNAMNKLMFPSNPEVTGTVGLLDYVRQYADYSRQLAAAGLPEDMTVLAFRDQVLQFRQAEEGVLWLLDMLYEVRSIQR